MKWGEYGMAQKSKLSKVLVTDYYTQKTIDGTKAYYVIKSDVYGPMGHELIPFESLEDAKAFKKDHFAKKIVKFNELTQIEVDKLDTDE